MFDSLDDQLKKDEQNSTTPGERYMRYAIVAVASVVLFGGLIFGVRYFS